MRAPLFRSRRPHEESKPRDPARRDRRTDGVCESWPVLFCTWGASYRSGGTVESEEKPQADRGDLYTLTAATFTVLTGFTRSSPTGLGRSEGIGRPLVGQRVPARSTPVEFGTASGAVGVECTRDIPDPRSSVLRPGDSNQVESKRATRSRIRSHPGGGRPAYVLPLSGGDGL